MWSSCALPDHHVFMYVLSCVNLNLWVRNCSKRPRDLIADRVGIHAIPYPKIYTPEYREVQLDFTPEIEVFYMKF